MVAGACRAGGGRVYGLLIRRQSAGQGRSPAASGSSDLVGAWPAIAVDAWTKMDVQWDGGREM